MAAPFLSVVTRHMPGRKSFLAINSHSLKIQDDQDYEQILMIDEIGRGWAYAQQMLVEATKKITGRYVLILDDDDLILNARATVFLKEATEINPPGVIFKTWHNQMGILPEESYWGKAPAEGHIGSCSFILRADIYREFVPRIDSGRYANDYDLIDLVYKEHGSGFVWLNMLLCWVMRRSIGRKQ